MLVKVINIDPTGKIRLSRKALLTAEEGSAPPPQTGGEPGEEAGAAAGSTREGGSREGGQRDGGQRGGRDRGGRDRGPRRE